VALLPPVEREARAEDLHRRRLPDDELRALVESVVDPAATAPFGLYVFGPDEPGAALGLHVEREVFAEAFGNTPGQLDEEYRGYHHASVFACVLDHRRRVPAGVLRFILPSAAGLKSLNDVEATWGVPFEALFEQTGVEYDPDATWDVATLAVTPEFRAKATGEGLVTMALAQASSMLAGRGGGRCAVAIMDLPVLDLVQQALHCTLAPFAGVEARPYLDSPASVPVWGRWRDWYEVLSSADRNLYEVICEGTGLEPVVAPPDWDAAAAQCREVIDRAASTSARRSRGADPGAGTGGGASRGR